MSRVKKTASVTVALVRPFRPRSLPRSAATPENCHPSPLRPWYKLQYQGKEVVQLMHEQRGTLEVRGR
jgi:hypothetical protein